MSAFGELEQAIVGAVGALEVSGAPLFASVRGLAPVERRAAAEAIARDRKPAALVVLSERSRGDTDRGAPGRPIATVYVACESLRSEDEARVGALAQGGLFAVLASVTTALQRAVVAPDRRLLLVQEGGVHRDGRVIVWEQVYEVRREAGLAAPLFAGSALCGADSDVRVEVGRVETAESTFGFPGIDGVFRQVHGGRGRRIAWRGTLRTADDAGLDAIEGDIEAAVMSGTAGTVTDAQGRPFAECVPVSFRRQGSRGRDDVSGEAVQAFELTFRQMNV